MSEWRTVENRWEINRYGSIRHRKNGRLLRLRVRNDGYVDVKLSYKRYLVHRLVATAFLPNPKGYLQVNHIDGNKANFSLENLEWCNQFGNMKHAVDTGLFPSRKGIKNGRATITEAQARIIKARIAEGLPRQTIVKELKISVYAVDNIKRGLTWQTVDGILD